MKKINSVLDEVFKNIAPSKEEIDAISGSLNEFIRKVKKVSSSMKIDVDIFVGGSFAKNTAIKKGEYDVDIFMRFDKKYGEDKISELARRILSKVGKFETIHGSRDYFRMQSGENLFFELIPVMKVKKPEGANNVTDLSYLHVKYVNKKLKSPKILEQVMLAKAFCHANKCYGAESYINGFSGYALELLVHHYGGFEKFLKGALKVTNTQKGTSKEVIDMEKFFKKKQDVLLDLNGAKLSSPIILVDPTHKYRNVLAALSEETFEKFKKSATKFLKNPSIADFEEKKTDLKKIKVNANKKKLDFVLIEASTDKVAGDVAGSKLLKFYRHLDYEINKSYKISKKGFNYNSKQAARCFFVAKSRGEVLSSGPDIKDKKNVKAFEKMHKSYFIKKGRIYAKEVIKDSLKMFLDKWKSKNKKKIKEMYITNVKVVS